MTQRLRQEKAAAIQNKSKWRLAAFIVGGVVGAAVLLSLVAFALILNTTPLPVMQTNPAAAQRLQRELDGAQKAAESGTPKVVGADETELNSWFKEYGQDSTRSAGGTAVVSDMRMGLVEDRLRLYALVNYGGRDITFMFEGKLHTSNGYVDFEPISGKIGSLPIPKASIKKAMQQMMTTPGGREAARLPKNLRDLRVENGKLIVVFR